MRVLLGAHIFQVRIEVVRRDKFSEASVRFRYIDRVRPFSQHLFGKNEKTAVLGDGYFD